MHDGGSGLRLNDGLDIKLSQVGWGLMLRLWPGPPWFKKWFPLTLACSGGLAKSTLSLFRHSDRFDCLADPTVQSLVKCGSCHCIFRLLQIFLQLFSWKTIVNLNNKSGSQYLTE